MSRWRERPVTQGVYSDVCDGTWFKQSILGGANIAPSGNLGRNTVIGFSGNGMNPFDDKPYSTWPLALICYDLPGHLRMTLPALWLLCIIPPHGPKSEEPDDFQPFLNILAVEMRMLSHHGSAMEMPEGSWK